MQTGFSAGLLHTQFNGLSGLEGYSGVQVPIPLWTKFSRGFWAFNAWKFSGHCP